MNLERNGHWLRRTWQLFVGGWIVVIATACSEVETPAMETVVWDSSGIRIAESALEGDKLARWKASSAHTLVGTSDGGVEHELYRVRGVARLQDGKIAVLNGSPPEVRLFDRDGRFLWKAGGSGSGPGEFVSPAVIHRLNGDSLVVYDPPVQRLTVLSSDGEVMRTISSAGQIFSFAGFVADNRAISSRGTLQLVLGRQIPNRLQQENPWINERVDVTTGVRDTITAVKGHEIFLSVTREEGGADRVAQFHVPFTVPPAVAVSGGRTYVLDPYRGAVEAYDGQGHLEGIIRTSESPRTVQRSHEERFVDELVERNPERAGEIRAAHQQISFPEVMPLYDRILADREGLLWLRRYDPFKSDRSHWVVFDADGRATGEVELPSALEVLHVGAGLVTALRVDELGVESLVELEVDPSMEDERSTSHN